MCSKKLIIVIINSSKTLYSFNIFTHIIISTIKEREREKVTFSNSKLIKGILVRKLLMHIKYLERSKKSI